MTSGLRSDMPCFNKRIMLNVDLYAVAIARDLSKAFETVRHATLLEKLAGLDLPDCAYKWLVDYFNGHSHCIRYRGQISTMQNFPASIIQGSAIKPASYVVNAANRKSITPGNELCKYADNTYLIIPASNVDSRTIELDNIRSVYPCDPGTKQCNLIPDNGRLER